jgi:hypothetical protein
MVPFGKCCLILYKGQLNHSPPSCPVWEQQHQVELKVRWTRFTHS